MTNGEWLNSLPKKFYDLYNTYAMMVICNGYIDQYQRWLNKPCKYEPGVLPTRIKKKEDDNA